MRGLLKIIQDRADFIETEKILNYMLFINTDPNKIPIKDGVINSIFKNSFEYFKKYFSNKYWGSDYRIENLLNDTNMEASLINHLIVSSLYTLKHDIGDNVAIAPYAISESLKDTGFFSLTEQMLTANKVGVNRLNLNNHTFFSILSAKASYELSSQNFFQKLKRIKQSSHYNSKILNTFYNNSDKLFLCNSDFAYNLCCAHYFPKTHKNADLTIHRNFCNNFKDEISRTIPQTATQEIDRLLLNYEFERYYSTELLDHIMRCRHVLFKSENPIFDLGNDGNFDRIMFSAAQMPNVFSRKTYVNFALAGLLSNKLVNNPFTMSKYNDILDAIATLIPPKLPRYEHENMWILLLEKFFLHLSHFVFPVIEKAFYITLYNYCESSNIEPIATFFADNNHETERKMLTLLYSFIRLEDDKTPDCNQEINKYNYIKNLENDFSPDSNAINSAASHHTEDESIITEDQRFNYIKSLYENVSNINVPPKKVKEFWNKYYNGVFKHDSINEYFDRTLSIDLFTNKPGKDSSEKFKGEIVSKYYNNVINNLRM